VLRACSGRVGVMVVSVFALAFATVNRLLVVLMFIALVLGTVLVFAAFDRDSHSASDTIRPFLVTMLPVWVVAVAAARVLLRRQA